MADAPYHVREIPIADIRPDPEQPRKIFDQDEIAGLGVSLREKGQLQPIGARPDPDRAGKFILVWGERRYHALTHIGAATAVARVVDLPSRGDIDVVQMIENDQRVEITPLERARAYRRTLDREGWSEAELATKLGLKQPWRVGQFLALLRVEPEYQRLLESRNLTETQIIEMAKLSPRGQKTLFDAIRRGQCPNIKALRTISAGLIEAEQQASMFGPAPAAPTAEERRRARSLAEKIDRVCDVLAAGFDDSEITATRKINPGQAVAYADKLALIQRHLSQMELALRSSAVQADLLAAA
jgi:ParB family chromosome partitioning protein